MRIEIGYKFIIGFIVVVAAVVAVPYAVSLLDLPEWARGLIPPLAAIAVGLTIGSVFSRGLTRQVGVLQKATHRIAEGDLRQGVDLGSRLFPDELDDLAGSINAMLTNLRQVVAQILRTATEVATSAQNLSATSEQINASAEEIAVTTEEVARGVSDQRNEVERITALFRELERGLERIDSLCRDAVEAARAAEQTAQGGGERARESFGELESVLQGLEGMAEVVVSFSDRIQQVHRFAEVITNLSRQTNLLALNAAIEASKAGDEGKGFAVVASEIRKLADSAERSAEQIATVLEELSEESRRVRGMVEASSRQLAGGREGLDRAERALAEITGLVADNTRRMEEILDRAEEQARGSREMAAFAERVQTVAESNASATHEVSTTIEHQTAAMEDMTRAAMHLSQMADDLTRRVERFQVPGAEEG